MICNSKSSAGDNNNNTGSKSENVSRTSIIKRRMFTLTTLAQVVCTMLFLLIVPTYTAFQGFKSNAICHFARSNYLARTSLYASNNIRKVGHVPEGTKAKPEVLAEPVDPLKVKNAATAKNDINSWFTNFYTQEEQALCKSTVDSIVKNVQKYASMETNCNDRVPTTLISSPMRSGKTTSLIATKIELEKRGYNVIFITFSAASGFVKQENESDLNALLRVMKNELLNIQSDDPKRHDSVSEKEINEMIKAFGANGEPVILLIDNLNALDVYQVREEVSDYLREKFLDPVGRYLVFTTHKQLYLDERFISKRSNNVVSVPWNISYEVLKESLKLQRGPPLTRFECAILLGCPALIKAHREEDLYGVARTRLQQAYNITWGTTELENVMYAIFKGERIYHPNNLSLACESQALIETDPTDGLTYARYSMIHISAIFEAFHSSKENLTSPIKAAIIELTNLGRQMNYEMLSFSKESDTVDYGFKFLFRYITVMKMLYFHLQFEDFDQNKFFLLPLSECEVQDLRFLPIPNEIVSLDKAKEYIQKVLKNNPSSNCLTLFVPQNKDFEYLDGFLVYTNERDLDGILDSKTVVSAYHLNAKGKDIEDRWKKAIDEATWISKVDWIELGSNKVGLEDKVYYRSGTELDNFLGKSFEFLKSLY